MINNMLSAPESAYHSVVRMAAMELSAASGLMLGSVLAVMATWSLLENDVGDSAAEATRSATNASTVLAAAGSASLSFVPVLCESPAARVKICQACAVHPEFVLS